MKSNNTIYFAGSIRGGRDDQPLYLAIIKMLAEYGDVLTEHIGRKDLEETGEKLSDKEIFDRDTDWIRKSTILIAEVTNPSMGVGYEIGLAESLGKPIVCLYRKIEGKNISAMLKGNDKIMCIEYRVLEDLIPIFAAHFQEEIISV